MRIFLYQAALLAVTIFLGVQARAGGFYQPIEPLPPNAPPGALLRVETMAGAPAGGIATKILYTSVGERGETIAVSGIVVMPIGAAPAEGRRIVAWAHPTSGIVLRCAPSLALQVFRGIQGLEDMLRRGQIVVATDYAGLGTAGPHPYLVGRSEARAVIDAVRAARNLPGMQAGNRFAVWGHSQGGQAALFTGLIARDYAPELNLVAVAAAAPATDLQALLRDDFDSDGGRNLTAMTLWSWSRVYDLPIDKLVLPSAMPAVNALAGECIESAWDIVRRMVSQRGLEHGFLTVKDLTNIEPWDQMLKENSPGPLPPHLPLLLIQGSADALVRPDVTLSYARRQCAAGGQVRLVVLPGATHGFTARDGAPAAVEWLTDRLEGKPASNDCGKSLSLEPGGT